jgi:predicted MFS family arabinose efflux permease
VNSDAAPAISERKLIFLLASVQFVNILDFMIVMPLGPAFATALGIPTARLGVIGGSYTAAASVAGLVAAQFLDRFDRRKALATAMLGLVTATAAAGLADSFAGLVAARALAGCFGGPATAVALAILADAVPPDRRGRAMGSVMGAFSAASVLGVPAGLTLSEVGGWRLPFLAVATLGVLVVAGALALMPPMTGHLARRKGAGRDGGPGPAMGLRRPLGDFLCDRRVQLSYLATAAAMMGAFAIIPHLATFLIFNVGYAPHAIPPLYFAGGIVSFFSMRLGGRVVDRRGPVPVVLFGSTLLLVLFALTFLPPAPLIPVIVMFVGFMLGNSVRMVGLQTLTSKIPAPVERGRFMSGQSAVQHMASAVGAGLSTVLLGENQNHSLRGMPRLALFSMALTALLPLLVWTIQRRMPVAAEASRVAAR